MDGESAGTSGSIKTREAIADMFLAHVEHTNHNYRSRGARSVNNSLICVTRRSLCFPHVADPR